MNVVLEPPPEKMAVFTHCPKNLLLHKNLLILAIKRQCWTIICYLALNFPLPFQNKSFTFTNKFIYKILKQPWLLSFSFIKSPGKWLKCSATFTKRERRNLATLRQTLKTQNVFSYLHFGINIRINQVMIFIM